MPITDNQREKRRKYLGSSDAPALVGVNPWKTAADVYYDKINPPSEKDSDPQNDAIIVGNMCEQAVLDWFAKSEGKKLLKNQSRVHANGIMAASFDALIPGLPEAVEAKTTGIIGRLNKDEWGEIGTDEVPDRVIIQCQHQMAVLPEIQIVWVPVLMGGVGFRYYRIDRNDDIIRHLEDREVTFWRQYVETKTPPPDSFPTLDTIKKIRREPKTIPIEGAVVQTWLEAREASTKADKAKEELQRQVLAMLGDAERGTCSFGELTYLEQVRKERIIPEATFRTVRFKKIGTKNEG